MNGDEPAHRVPDDWLRAGADAVKDGDEVVGVCVDDERPGDRRTRAAAPQVRCGQRAAAVERAGEWRPTAVVGGDAVGGGGNRPPRRPSDGTNNKNPTRQSRSGLRVITNSRARLLWTARCQPHAASAIDPADSDPV
jgi:hypothetical protein